MHKAMHSLIIHMSSSTLRRGNVDQLLALLPQAQVIEAVDGRREEAQRSLTLHNGNLHRPTYPFALGGGEIGCFLSHRKCWQKIVDEGWAYGLIVEDDFDISSTDFNTLIALTERNLTPDSFIRIPPKDREPMAQMRDREEHMILHKPRVIGLQTTAQIVGRGAAQKLLDATKEIDRPVDTFLQMHWVTGLEILTVLPNGSSEKQFETGSTVQQKSLGFFAKLKREIARGLYRLAVKRRPQI